MAWRECHALSEAESDCSEQALPAQQLLLASEPHTAERLSKRGGIPGGSGGFGMSLARGAFLGALGVARRYLPELGAGDWAPDWKPVWGFATFRLPGGNEPWPPSQAYSPIT